MSDVVNLINFSNWKIVLTGVVIFIAAVIGIVKAFDFITERFGIETKKMREAKAQKKDIIDLKEKMVNFEAQREIDVRKSEENDEAIKVAISSLSSDVEELRKMVAESKEHDRENRVAQLKDMIGQRYRHYHSRGYWSSMEKEAMEGLIDNYLKSGGNGFVKHTVEPEMPTWEIRD